MSELQKISLNKLEINAHKTDNLKAICEPFPRKCWSLDISQPYGSSWPVTGIAYQGSKTTEVHHYINFQRPNPQGT
jgi:hypothetical protein